MEEAGVYLSESSGPFVKRLVIAPEDMLEQLHWDITIEG